MVIVGNYIPYLMVHRNYFIRNAIQVPEMFPMQKKNPHHVISMKNIILKMNAEYENAIISFPMRTFFLLRLEINHQVLSNP